MSWITLIYKPDVGCLYPTWWEASIWQKREIVGHKTLDGIVQEIKRSYGYDLAHVASNILIAYTAITLARHLKIKVFGELIYLLRVLIYNNLRKLQ